MAKSKLGSAKRFGPRYGRTLKHVLAKIETAQKKKYNCPYCGKSSVKRLFYGIWECKNCNSKFTSKAYRIDTDTFTAKKEADEQW